MSFNILIIGTQTFNSGKTFLTKLLSKILKNEFDVEVFKPISGSNYFYHPDNIVFASTYGSIISRDLRTTHDKLNHNCNNFLEILNPIHTLFFPVGMKSYIENKMRPMLDMTFDQPMLVRYSTISKHNQPITNYIMNKKLHGNSIIDKITSKSDGITEFNTMEELNYFLLNVTEKTLRKCFNSLRNHDILIIEGFNNYIPPKYISLEVDMIFIAGPGIISIIEAQKFKKAINYLNKEIISTDKIVELTDVENIFEIPFMFNDDDLNMEPWNSIKKNVTDMKKM